MRLNLNPIEETYETRVVEVPTTVYSPCCDSLIWPNCIHAPRFTREAGHHARYSRCYFCHIKYITL